MQYLQELMDKKNNIDMKKKLKKEPTIQHAYKFASLQVFIDEYVNEKYKCKYQIYLQKQKTINELL